MVLRNMDIGIEKGLLMPKGAAGFTSFFAGKLGHIAASTLRAVVPSGTLETFTFERSRAELDAVGRANVEVKRELNGESLALAGLALTGLSDETFNTAGETLLVLALIAEFP